MNRQTDNNPGRVVKGEPDSTLRLIARLPAPDGLEERVKTGLRTVPVRRAVNMLDWPHTVRVSWIESNWIRGAAAAAIVALVAGGSWGVYSRVQPKQAQVAIPRVGVSAGFSSANAMRTPKTLDVPVIKPRADAEGPAVKKRVDGKKAMPRKPAMDSGASPR